jgi:hypothetical protein
MSSGKESNTNIYFLFCCDLHIMIYLIFLLPLKDATCIQSTIYGKSSVSSCCYGKLNINIWISINQVSSSKTPYKTHINKLNISVVSTERIVVKTFQNSKLSIYVPKTSSIDCNYNLKTILMCCVDFD